MSELLQSLSFIERLGEIFRAEREALTQPEEEVAAHERIIGSVESNIARALMSSVLEIMNAFNRTIPDQLPKNCDLLELAAKKHRVERQCQLLNRLFWEAVLDEFPQCQIETQEKMIGIRKGWILVEFDVLPTQSNTDFIIISP